MSFHRPEMDTEWTYIREPIETNSMVLKGLLPETEYQFIVRAVNVHGASPPSQINNPVRTLGKAKRWSLSQRAVMWQPGNLHFSCLVSWPHFKTKSVSVQFQQYTHTELNRLCLFFAKLLSHLTGSTTLYKSQRYCGDSRFFSPSDVDVTNMYSIKNLLVITCNSIILYWLSIIFWIYFFSKFFF